MIKLKNLLPLVEGDCSIIALKTLGIPITKINKYLNDIGYSKETGVPTYEVIHGLKHNLGFPNAKISTEFNGLTARELSGKKVGGKWLVFVKGHVMPLVGGRISNFCGHGDFEVKFAVKLK